VTGAKELLQRRGEVAGGQAVQKQQRQRFAHLRRLAAPGGQDRRACSAAASICRAVADDLIQQ